MSFTITIYNTWILQWKAYKKYTHYSSLVIDFLQKAKNSYSILQEIICIRNGQKLKRKTRVEHKPDFIKIIISFNKYYIYLYLNFYLHKNFLLSYRKYNTGWLQKSRKKKLPDFSLSIFFRFPWFSSLIIYRWPNFSETFCFFFLI